MNRQPPGDLFVEGDPAVDHDVDLTGAAAALSVHYQTAYRLVYEIGCRWQDGTLAELQQRARDVDGRRPNVRRVMP